MPPSPLWAYNEHCVPSPPSSDTAQEHGSGATPQCPPQWDLYQASEAPYYPTSSSIPTPSFSFVPSSSFPPSPSSFEPFEAPYSSHPGAFGSPLPSSLLGLPACRQRHCELSVLPLSLSDIIQASALDENTPQCNDFPEYGHYCEPQYSMPSYSSPLSSYSSSPSSPSSGSSGSQVFSSPSYLGNFSCPPSSRSYDLQTFPMSHGPTYYQQGDYQTFTQTATPLQATDAVGYHENSAYPSTVNLHQPPPLTPQPFASGTIQSQVSAPNYFHLNVPSQPHYFPHMPEDSVDAPAEMFLNMNTQVDVGADDDKAASAHTPLSSGEPPLAKHARNSFPEPLGKKAKGKGSRARRTKPADDDDYAGPSGSVSSTRGRHPPRPPKPPPSAPPAKNSRKRSHSTFASSSGDDNDFGPSSSSTSLHKHHYKGSKLIPGAALVPAPKPNKGLPRTKRDPVPSPVNLVGTIKTKIKPVPFLACNEKGITGLYLTCHYSFPDNKTECLGQLCSNSFPRHVAIHRRQEALTLLAALASKRHAIDVTNFDLVMEATLFFITGTENCSPPSTGHPTKLILGGTDYQPVPSNICNKLKDAVEVAKGDLNNLSLEDLAVFKCVAIHIAQLYAYVWFSCTCNPDWEQGLGGWSRSDRSLSEHPRAPVHHPRGVWRGGIPARPFKL